MNVAELDALLEPFAGLSAVAGKSALAAWRQMRIEASLAVPHWPRAAGGRDFTARQYALWHQRLINHRISDPYQIATDVVGPLLLTVETGEARAWLDDIRELNAVWTLGRAESVMHRGRDAVLTNVVVPVAGLTTHALIRVAGVGYAVTLDAKRRDGLVQSGALYFRETELCLTDARGLPLAGKSVPHAGLATGLLSALRQGAGALRVSLAGTADGYGGTLIQDADLMQRVHAFEVELQALEGTFARANAEGVEAHVRRQLRALVVTAGRRALGQLVALRLEALGYGVLVVPDFRPGVNEPPVGGPGAADTLRAWFGLDDLGLALDLNGEYEAFDGEIPV